MHAIQFTFIPQGTLVSDLCFTEIIVGWMVMRRQCWNTNRDIKSLAHSHRYRRGLRGLMFRYFLFRYSYFRFFQLIEEKIRVGLSFVGDIFWFTNKVTSFCLLNRLPKAKYLLLYNKFTLFRSLNRFTKTRIAYIFCLTNEVTSFRSLNSSPKFE